MNIIYNNLILVPTITFFITVTLKGIVIYLQSGKLDLENALGTGGMPSVHSAVVVSLTTAIAIKFGIDSDLFALSMAFTLIIIYDAINIRFEAGRHAAAINKTLGEKKYKESLGHLPSEAFAGSVLGIIIAMLLSFI